MGDMGNRGITEWTLRMCTSSARLWSKSEHRVFRWTGNHSDQSTRYRVPGTIGKCTTANNYCLLLQLDHGADPNVFDRKGLSPMMLACRKKEKGIPAIE